MHPQRTLIEAAELIVENVKKISFLGHDYIPDGTDLHVVRNPSPDQIKGLCNKADREGYGAESGEVRWFVKGKDLHAWQSPHTVHHDVYNEIHGEIRGNEYSKMEHKDDTFASGSFIRNNPDKPDHWHIGHRQGSRGKGKGPEMIKNHPSFDNLRDHEGKPRKVERFDT